MMSSQPCNLQIHIDAKQTFFLNENIISAYSGRLRKMIKQYKRRATQIKNSDIEISDFPGGPDGFELVLRFFYNNGRTTINFSNVSLLYCCAVFLDMTEEVSNSNLIQQTEDFLKGMFYWSWNDLLLCLKSCASFFTYSVSSGLMERLICALLVKIAQNSDTSLLASSSSSSSSPENTSRFRLSSSAETTPELIKPCSSGRAWWFDDIVVLPPKIIEKFIQGLGSYGSDNNSLILTRFLLYYLKTAAQSKTKKDKPGEYGGLADTAVFGVILIGKKAFSWRGLLWVYRVVSGYGLSRDCRVRLERLIGGMLDQATLDDLLVSGRDRGIYDVNLVLRLIRVFVNTDGVCLLKLNKVGRLVDKYLGEISPDPNLKISKFLGVAESLPDSARDCFDGVYRAFGIYLESHPNLSLVERTALCRCLNYKKLSPEACKDLAKNPRIPPLISIQALISQQSKISTNDVVNYESRSTVSGHQMVLCSGVDSETLEEENEDMKLSLKKMQWRVVESEKVCKEMKGNMSRLVRQSVTRTPAYNRSALPRLC